MGRWPDAILPFYYRKTPKITHHITWSNINGLGFHLRACSGNASNCFTLRKPDDFLKLADWTVWKGEHASMLLYLPRDSLWWSAYTHRRWHKPRNLSRGRVGVDIWTPCAGTSSHQESTWRLWKASMEGNQTGTVLLHSTHPANQYKNVSNADSLSVR